MTGDDGWNDALYDAIALCEADVRGDRDAAHVIWENCDSMAVAGSLIRLAASARADREAGGHVCPGCLREWALSTYD